MMQQYFTEEHELFRQSVKQFIDTEVKPHITKWEKEEKLPRELFIRMGGLGFLGINFSEKYGGTGNDFWYSVVYLEEMAKSGFAGLGAAVSVHQYMATNHIALAGSEELKQRYLPKSITGEYIGSIAITEPGAGSDVANIRTTAVREGEYYIINGSKTFITNGVYGNFVTVACKTDSSAGMAGISLIVVDAGTPGYTSKKLDKMGWKSSDTGELFFDNVKVPVSNLVGNEGQGFFYIMESFQLERLIAGILAVAGCEDTISITQKYMEERSAFNKPLNKFQVLRHKLVDLITETAVTKQFIYHCCWLQANGHFAVKECSMAKLKATELSKTVVDECLQVFGGYGYMSEYPIERAYRDARVGTIVAGTSEIMREIISKTVIDKINYESTYETMRAAANLSSSPTPKEAVSESNQPTPTTAIEHPTTAREILYSLPERLSSEKLTPDTEGVFHFKMDGEGDFTITLKDGAVTVVEGLKGEPNCEVKAKAKDYADIELGKTNPQMAFMMGKIKISNISLMMKFMGLFKRLSA